MSDLGKALLVIGGGIAGLGLVLLMAAHLGGFPGDILIRRKNLTFYFPVVTCLVLSALLTLIMWILHGRR